MNNTKFLSIMLFSLLILFFSCKKDQDIKPQDSNAHTGSYSGVLVGSSGYYIVDLFDDGANSTIVFDSVTYNLSSNEALINGQSITLTDGTISLIISIDSNGENPSISFTIPGHNIEATIFLNTNNVVEHYNGTSRSIYRTIDNGTVVSTEEIRSTYNMSISGSTFESIERVVYSTTGQTGETIRATGNVERIGASDIKFTLVIDGQEQNFIANESNGVISYYESNNTSTDESSFEFTFNRVN